MEKMKTENINDVVKNLESVCVRLDVKSNKTVVYTDFKVCMFNYYGVDVENL